MKLKLDDAGHAVLADGRPVYVHDDGKEVPFDAAATVATLNRTLDESKGYKTRAQTAEQRAAAFEGIEDPEAARSALATVKNLSSGELKTAAQVAEIQEAARKAAEEQVRAAAEANGRKIKDLTGETEKLRGELYSEKVGGSFARSKFIAEKVAVPRSLLQSHFGQSFKIEEGRVVGYDGAGNKLYSRANPGQLADFDEAVEMLIDSHPDREALLKGTGSTGSGARPSNGSAGGATTMTRTAFQALSPAARAETMKAGTKLVD